MTKAFGTYTIVKDTVYSERIPFRNFTKVVIVAPSGWSGGLVKVAVAAQPSVTPVFLFDTSGCVVHVNGSLTMVGGVAYEVPSASIAAAPHIYAVSSSVNAAADAALLILRG